MKKFFLAEMEKRGRKSLLKNSNKDFMNFSVYSTDHGGSFVSEIFIFSAGFGEDEGEFDLLSKM